MISKSITDVLHFISSVQNSCDKHRVCVEQRWHQEYIAHLAHRKQSQNETKNETNNDRKEDSTFKDDMVKELEELNLADSLLKKARSIRSKHEKFINGIVDLMSISSSDYPVLHTKPVISSRISDKSKINKKIPYSKSDFIASSHKSIVVPRSKSASVAIVPKDNMKSSYYKCSSSKSLSNHIKHVNKGSGSTAVISSKELTQLKGLHVNICTSAEMKLRRNSSFSDSSGNINQHQAPAELTPSQFLSAMKNCLNTVGTTNLKLRLWYPFLSDQNEVLLTTVKCHKSYSLRKMCNMLHDIQETMLWMDLLYLIERDICPNVVYDEKDGDVLRICSYLLSIFHPYSQRIPILDPNG